MSASRQSGVILQPGGLVGRPLLFGEVLFDEFMDGSVVLGGAPFNVAWHLRGFGLDPLLISRVGGDVLGDRLLERLRAQQLDTEGIQRDDAHPTGRVRVTLVDDQPLFSILPQQAYDFIDAAHLPPLDSAHSRFSLLYHGSLAVRNTVSAQALAALRDSGLPIFIDINLRPPWWSLGDIEALLAGGRWLKLNHDELAELSELAGQTVNDLLHGARSLCNRFGLQTVIVTRGSQGAVAVTADGMAIIDPVPVDGFTDSVGAGDAFSAVVLVGIQRGWALATALRRAASFAAAVCATRGAIPDQADFYQPLWTHGSDRRQAAR